MSRRRFIGVFFGIVGAVLLVVVLYVAFGDLGRHKARIEAFVSQTLGRPFAIDGPLKIRLLPVIDVSAEGVRLGNVPGGSQPQMLEIGKVAVQIGFWSLISGPPDVRSFELSDASVLLENGPDGKSNWIMGTPKAEEETEAEDEANAKGGAAEVPVVIRSAHLSNVRVVYREAKKPDRVAQLDKLSIGPGQNELLALDGQGMLGAYPLSLKGDAGPLKSLLSARDMRMDMKVSLGKLALDFDGMIGRLDPLDGIDLTLKVTQPDVGAMLEKLDLPVITTGPVRIEGKMKDAGDRTQLDFDAKVGDLDISANGSLKELSLVGADLAFKVDKPEIGATLEALKLPVIATGPMHIDTRIKDVGKVRQLDLKAKLGDLDASVKGTLKSRGLVGSDLKFEARAADAARLAKVFDVTGVPAAPLTVAGHTLWARKEIKFDSVSVSIADASVRADGSKQFTGDQKIVMNFQVAAASLKKLKDTLPELKVAASGAFESAKDRLELKNLQATLGKTQLAGSLLLIGSKQIEAELSSPRVDLTPFMPPEKPAEAGADGKAAPPPPPPPEAPKKKFVFDEKPLPLVKMKDTDAKVHLAFGELILGDRSFKDIDSNLRADHGKFTFDMRAAGTHEGTLQGAGTLVAGGDGTADLDLKIDISNVRASLGSGDIAPAEVPPLGVVANIKIHGSSPRQMAAGANGQSAADPRCGAYQERLHRRIRWGFRQATRVETQSLCQGRSVHDARLHHCPRRHHQWQGHPSADTLSDRKSYRDRAGHHRPAHGEVIAGFQYAAAQRHRRQSRHVHQPAHPPGRNLGQSQDGRGREGRGVGRAGRSDRRCDGGRRWRDRSHGGRKGFVRRDADRGEKSHRSQKIARGISCRSGLDHLFTMLGV